MSDSRRPRAPPGPPTLCSLPSTSGCVLLTPGLIGRVPNAWGMAEGAVTLHVDIGKGAAMRGGAWGKVRLAYRFYGEVLRTAAGLEEPPRFIDFIVPDDWSAAANAWLAHAFKPVARKLGREAARLGLNARFIAVARRFMARGEGGELTPRGVPRELLEYDGAAIDANTNTTLEGENIKCSREPGKCLSVIRAAAPLVRDAVGEEGVLHLMGPPMRRVLQPLMYDPTARLFDTVDTVGWRLDVQHVKHEAKKRGAAGLNETLLTDLVMMRKYLN